MLILGPVVFQAFEVPETIGFGGSQSLTVHRLPGGMRVIDVMGRDDADLRWSGIFSGPLAADRARTLDLLRAQGRPLSLSWDAFFYTVVIARFEADYTRPTWIAYRITCKVLADEAAQFPELPIALAALAVADATSASGYDATVAGLPAGLALPGAATAGTQANAAALAALGDATSSLNARVAGFEGAMTPPADGTSLAALADTAGSLAAGVAARTYVARAAANLGNAST